MAKNDKRYDIIDGQQRITTFIIMSCVFRDFFIDELTDKTKDYVNLSIKDQYEEDKPKLKLLTDVNNRNYFELNILKKITEGGEKSKFSEKAHYINEYIKTQKEELESFADFVNWIYERVVLATIICPSEDVAIQIFNVLNDRGMPLTSADILKSSLMIKLDDDGKKTFKAEWDKVNNSLKNEELKIENMLNLYLYYLKASNPKTVIHKELLEVFKDKNSLDVIENINKFSKEYIDIFNSECKEIYCLRYLPHSVYWQSILLTAKFIEYKDFDKLQKLLVSYYYQIRRRH